jgi:hypothetical protein
MQSRVLLRSNSLSHRSKDKGFFRSLNKRTYFAAVATKKFIAARLKNRSGEWSLETREPHAYYSVKRFGLRESDGIFKYFQQKFKLESWRKKFFISSAGMIIHNFESPISSDYISKQRSTHIHGNEYIPDLLYSIPQDAWEDFISKLQYQELVNLLNLSAHRHLWPAYNYAARADDAQIKKNRAANLGEYHFLESFLSQGRLFRECRLYIPPNLDPEKVSVQIDQGKKVMEIFKDQVPYLTPLFINKFAHYPYWENLGFIGTLITLKATNANGDMDKKKLSEFIDTLPSSTKNPDLFSKMIKDTRGIKVQLDPFSDKIKSNVFYSFHNNFGFFKEKNCDASLLKDYFQAITNDLIFPELLRISKNNHFNFDIGQYIRRSEIDICKKLSHQVATFFTERVSSLDKLISLEKRWHRNVTVIDSKKPVEAANIWHPLFNTQTIDQVIFSCLTTPIQLKKEGREMDHCIGGYSAKCMDGIHHVVKAVSQTTGNRATLLLEINNKTESVHIVEIRSQRNQAPSKEVKNASHELINCINRKKIELNPYRGKDTRHVKNGEEVVSTVYPFNLDDQVAQEQIYQAYKTTQTLPIFMNADSYSAALQKSGLENMINVFLHELLSTESNIPAPPRAQL